MTEEKCECEATTILVFPCSGSSNVGQMANLAGLALTRAGRAKMYCLAGVGAHVPGMLDSTRGADYRIAIDGCSVACARKTLEHAGMSVEHAVIVTDLGIKKTHDLVWTNQDIRAICDAAMRGVASDSTPCCGSGCGCSAG